MNRSIDSNKVVDKPTLEDIRGIDSRLRLV